MNKIIILLLLLPVWGISQSSPEPGSAAVADSFEINGKITGYEDGTSVSFLNQNTGVPEKQTVFQKGKFRIKGQLKEPSFIILIFGDQPPAVPLFIGNSAVQISGDKAGLDHLTITGSATQDEFSAYSKALKPYEAVLNPDAVKDPASLAAVEKISSDFVRKHPSSYVAPLAIIRILQASENAALAGELYQLLSGGAKRSVFSRYAGQQIQLASINPIGSEATNFSQKDTAGHLVSLSSFRGKYVLIDFWASWCRPCRMENPNVVAAYNKYQDKNFTVLGVSLDQAKPAWISAIHMDGLNWTQVSDLKGWGNQVAALFHVTSIPQNLLIGPDGKIIAKNLRGEALDKKLSGLFD